MNLPVRRQAFYKLSKIFTIMLGISLITGCASLRNWRAEANKPSIPPSAIQQTKQQGYPYRYTLRRAFNKVDVSGNIPVHIIGWKKPEQQKLVLVAKDPSDFQTVKVNCCTDTMTLSGQSHGVKAILYMSTLNTLTSNSSAPITGEGVTGSNGTIISNGSGAIDLHAPKFSLRKLSVNGNGNVKLQGLSTHMLTVKTARNSLSNIMLNGVRIGLHQVDAGGHTKVNISNIIPTPLDLITRDSANVTLSGHIKLLRMQHLANSNIKLIGVNSHGLDLVNDVAGNITLEGGDLVLNKVVNRGSGSINVKKAVGYDLNVLVGNDSHTDLQGHFSVKKVEAKDKAELSMLWLQDNDPKIIASGHSRVKLAGLADQLTTNAKDKAKIDARYLRTQTVYAKAYDSSATTLWPIKALNARAVDNSNIYYFKQAKFKGNYMGNAGAVLPLSLGKS